MTVFEAVDVAHAASGRAGGFLARSWCDSGPTRLLARAGYDLHASLAAELGLTAEDTGYRPVSTISLSVKDEKSGGDGAKGKKSQHCDALPVWVDSENLSDCDVIGTPADTAQVHPGHLTRALLSAAERAGAKLIRQRVVGIDVSEATTTVQSVRLSDGTTCATDVVVLTMGPWTGRGLTGFFGMKAGLVDGSRAHSISLRPPVEAAIDATALFLSVRDDDSHRKCLDPEIYPRPDGTVYVCLGADDPAALPDNPADVKWDEAACQRLERIAGRVSSRLVTGSSVVMEQCSACYLPNPWDGRGPLLGVLPGVKGAFVAAGHSCWGILQVNSVLGL